MRIHLVVNISQVVWYREQVEEQKVEEVKIVEIDGVEEQEIEKILNERKVRGVVKYLVRWKRFIVVATTRYKVQQLHKRVKLLVGNQVGKITRELNKESLLNQSPIYTKHAWSMLPIIKPALLSMLQPHVHLIPYSRPPCCIHVP